MVQAELFLAHSEITNCKVGQSLQFQHLYLVEGKQYLKT